MSLTALRAAGVLACLVATPAMAQGTAAGLAKQLSNPISNLISVPFQLNYNQGHLDGDGDQYQLNIQPVVPVSISPNWNVISRTIVPIISQDGVVPDQGSQFGLGTTTQSFFFSPKEPTRNGLIWGVGPAFLIPTATDDIASNQWGVGVTGVALKQNGPWTVGGLANHLWSTSSDDDARDISATFLQPFVSYTTPKATSFTLNSESTYDWEKEDWSVPVNAVVSQVIQIGERPVQFGLGARYWLDSPDSGPEGWGARAQVTLLFPTQ